MNKKIVIEIQVEDGSNADKTIDTLFASATDAVAHPVGLGLAKYTVVHQHIENAKGKK